MEKGHYGLILVVALIAGFVGGFISHQLFMDRPAFAEKQPMHQKVVRGEQFDLVDRSGKIRGSWNVSKDGDPMLILFDNTGTPRFTLTVAREGACLSLNNKGGVPCANLLETKFGSVLRFFDENGSMHVGLGMDTNEGPYLSLRDKSGLLKGLIDLCGEDGRPVWSAP